MNNDSGSNIDYMTARHLLRQPNHRMSGFLVVVLSLLLASAVGWAAWAEVEELVRADGRVEPAGRAKLINHERGGKVAELHVRNGSVIKAGDPLITLDAEMSESERLELLGQWQVRAFEVERLKSEAQRVELNPEDQLAEDRPDLFEAQSNLMTARRDAFNEQSHALAQVIQSKREDLRATTAEVSRIDNSLSLLDQQMAAVSELYERGLYPKLKLVSLQRQLSDTESERSKALASLAGARAAMNEAQSKLLTFEKQWRRDVLADLGRTTAERDQLWERLQSQDALIDGLVIAAPVDGVIQELAVTGVGQSIAANAAVMKLVPVGGDLVVQADVANDDISKIKAGMDVAIKVRAYDFTRFGTLDGTVEKIAADSHLDRTDDGFDYRVTIATDTHKLSRDSLDILPGMLVSVEMKVGERTILSYLTDRIIDWRDRAFTDS